MNSKTANEGTESLGMATAVADSRGGRSPLIIRLSKKFRTSQPICPANMREISISRDDHIRVA